MSGQEGHERLGGGGLGYERSVSANSTPTSPLPPEPSESSVVHEQPAAAEQIARPLGHTRVSATWTGIGASLVALALLLVFILLNLQRVDVDFYGAHKQVPLAIALLFALVLGGVLVFAIGTVRILQVRARAKRQKDPVGPHHPGGT